ncbi:MAG: glycosyltransferase [FCB group bacterium]|nr:glycosyltransferase [FCB group bacterium]
MPKTPDIKYTVVIPVYNAEKTVGRTLDALLAQKGAEHLEIIAVNDGSTDKTPQILRQYPVRVLHQQNSGPASARNHGFREALGDIILFTDSDCIPQPGWLEHMTAPFADPEISGVKGIYITRQKSLVARFVQLEFEERYRMLEKLQYIDFVDSYSAAFRKTALDHAGGFDESFPKADNEDVDLSFKLAADGFKMVYAPKAIVEHTHPVTLKKYLSVKFSRGFWRMAVYKMHPGKAVKDSYTPQTLKFQILTAGFWWLTLLFALFTGVWPPHCAVSALFILLTLPFIAAVFTKDPLAALLTPVMLFLRANCFLLGVKMGLLKNLLRR